MKKEEKTRLTKEKILQAAIQEFGTKNYERASLTSICHDYNLSKGLIYHNFKSKDDLYLACLSICYEKMIHYFNEIPLVFSDVTKQLSQFLSARQAFFQEFPCLANLFFQSLFMPPEHLQKEIEKIRHEYNCYMKKRYQDFLSNLPLKLTIDLDQAVNYMMIFQDMYNHYFQSISKEGQNMHTLIDLHEEKLPDFINIVLYGIVESNTDKFI